MATTEYQQIDDGKEAGACLFRATGKGGFFGTTPVAKTTVTFATTAAVISQVATSGKWAFSTSTAAKAIAAGMVALKKLGLF